MASPVVVPKEEPKKKASSLFEDEEDKKEPVVTAPVVVPKEEPKKETKKTTSLFGDEEDFMPKPKTETKSPKVEQPKAETKKKEPAGLFDDEFNFHTTTGSDKKNKRLADREKKMDATSNLKLDDPLSKSSPLSTKPEPKTETKPEPVKETTPVSTPTSTPVTSSPVVTPTVATETVKPVETKSTIAPVSTSSSSSKMVFEDFKPAAESPKQEKKKATPALSDDPLSDLLNSVPTTKKKKEVTKNKKNDIDSFVDDILGGPKTSQPKATKKANIIDDLLGEKSSGLFGDEQSPSTKETKKTKSTAATSSPLFDDGATTKKTQKKKAEFHSDLFDF